MLNYIDEQLMTNQRLNVSPIMGTMEQRESGQSKIPENGAERLSFISNVVTRPIRRNDQSIIWLWRDNEASVLQPPPIMAAN
ncbi:hypothetical protein QLX08_002824 [Tetragonisca angustula]|uniref:Uncharacterized protein n=1 Tax=Tetragonisca angustula TaxID=166442 RepID=A0AAW1A9X2_9HYME